MPDQPANGAVQAPPGMTLPEKVIEQIRISDIGLQKAAAAEQAQQAKQAQVEALIPQVVDTMIRHERITPNQREKLAGMLRDPAQVLELMIKVAGHRNADELSRLGVSVNPDSQEKTAADRVGTPYDPASSMTSPYVGARTTMVKQSDLNLFKKLGLSPPSL